MDKEKEFRGARYVRGTLTLSRFFFRIFFVSWWWTEGGMPYIEIFRTHPERISLSVSLSHSSLTHLFLSLVCKQTKKMGFSLSPPA